jgi:hypothetical protein
LLHAWVTAENVNDLVTSCGFDRDIDLLSLDMDGMDYWVWKALTCARPRVVVAEYESTWGPEARMTRPYRPDFGGDTLDNVPTGGASLPALVALGREKGYRLVGCDRFCYNAFFLRNDVGADRFPEIPARDCFHHLAIPLRYQLLPFLRKTEWVEV